LVSMAKITADGEAAWNTTASTQDANLRFFTAADGSLGERLRITSAGLVGIGTSTPSTRLSVAGGISGTAGANISGAGWGVLPYVANSLVIDNNAGEARFFATGADATTRGSFIFYNGETDGGAGAAMVIDSSSRVGIGTASASTILHVASTAPYIRIQDTDSSTGVTAQGGFEMYDNDGDRLFYLANESSSSSDVSLFNIAGGALKFGTSGSERGQFDSSGRLLVGTSTARALGTYGVNQSLQIETPDGGNWPGLNATWNRSSDGFGPRINLAKSRSSAIGGNTVVQNGDELGGVYFYGADGTDLESGGASIVAIVDGTPGANDMPGRLVFSTTADGSASPTEAMRINNQQELLVGTATRTANGGKLQISNGITFPATAVACTNANTLDDYEEGTWTPTYADFDTWTSPTFNAFYTKIGRLVTVVLNQTGGTLGWSSSQRMGGLPFAPSEASTGYFTDSFPSAADQGGLLVYTNSALYFATAVASETGLILAASYYTNS